MGEGFYHRCMVGIGLALLWFSYVMHAALVGLVVSVVWADLFPTHVDVVTVLIVVAMNLRFWKVGRPELVERIARFREGAGYSDD